jgi:RsiW-degrading membrane proteinase PrsW (M82 family)
MMVSASIRAVRVTAGALCLAGAVILALEFLRYLQVFPGPAALAVILELPLLVVGFFGLRLLRPVRSPELIWSAAALVWGATAAAGCALLANQGLLSLWAKTAGIAFASNWSNSLSAPLNEETLKLCGVLMIVLAAPQMIKVPLDGMIFGALTGLGFQVVENVTYGLENIVQSGATDPDYAVRSSWLLRVGSTAIGSHWTMTAVAGAGVGFLVLYGRGGRRREGVALAAGCLAAAVAMHVLFDAPRPSIEVKVAVDVAVAGVMYVWLRDGYMTRARGVLHGYADSGVIGPAAAPALLSRRARHRQLRQAASAPERERLLAWQQEMLTTVDDEVGQPPDIEAVRG